MCIMSNDKHVHILCQSVYIQPNASLESGVSGSAVMKERDKGQINGEKQEQNNREVLLS